ncbi:MAG: Rpn family recombination-promoting nuclease/putative transposase [Prevotella sp.]|nr:Rpn family recombination-promoting nuclease/putative transposase [Prevotella sp.]
MQYLNGENLGDSYGDRRSVFDVYCMTRDGSRFIAEMQKAPKGKWDYHLEDVYTAS